MATAGQTLKVPFVGRSSQARQPWYVFPHYANGTLNLSNTDFSVETDLGPSDPGCGPEIQLNDGVTGGLQVQVPPDAASGDWAVFWIHSVDTVMSAAGCWPPEDADSYHWWPVGIYVP